MSRTSRSTNPCSTSATSRRRPTRPGPERGCPPNANGRRRAPGTRSAARAGAIRGGPRSRRRHVANLGGDALRPAPVGAYPGGASAYGVEQMLGDVWEWTSSELEPWPGFTPMIYQRYSEPFFGGDYRVLRGGSWAVESSIVRPSFRNWDHPYRRQIFSGAPAGVVGRRRSGGPPLMCRHLGWLGREISVSSLVLDPPQRPSGAVVRSASAKARPAERRRLGRGLFRRRRRRGAGAAPHRCGEMFRSIPSHRHFAAIAWSRRCVRLPSGCRSKPARRPRSPTGTGCCRTTGSSTAMCCPPAQQPNPPATAQFSLL